MMIWVLFRHWNSGRTPIVGRIAAEATGWDYVHCALAIPVGDRVMVAESSMRGGFRMRELSEDEWPIASVGAGVPAAFAIPVAGCDMPALAAFLRETQRAGYDWYSVILDKLLGLTSADDPDRWFCSEFVIEALKRASCLPDDFAAIPSNAVLPRDLYRMLTINQRHIRVARSSYQKGLSS